MAQKNKVWAKKTLKTNWATSGLAVGFGGQSEFFSQRVK
jgi:hypothetical protein